MRHSEKTKKILWMGGFILLFLCFRTAIGCTVCSSFFRVFIDARFEQPERVQVFYGVRPHFTEARSKRTAEFPAGERMQGTTDINNHVARRLRIDLGEHAGLVRLYGLRLNSFFFREEARFSPEDIARRFVPGPGATMRLAGDHVEIVGETNDPHILLQGVLRHRSLFLDWVLPLVMAAGAALLLSGFSPRTFPALADLLGRKRSSAGLHFDALDGVRGFAALAVLAEHVGILGNAIGAVGVLLFFSLSGFLLSIPFVRNPDRAVSFDYMRTYMKRRLLRIIPMYYTVITILFLFRHRIPDVFRHYLFLQGDGYLWTVPQEMFFYLLLPPVAIGLYGLSRVDGRLRAGGMDISLLVPAVLLTATVAGAWAADHRLITLYGNGEARPVLVGVFLGGMFFASLHQTLQNSALRQGEKGETFRRVLGAAGLACLLIVLLLARNPAKFEMYGHSGLVGFLAAFIVFSVVGAPASPLARCMSWTPLRAIGVTGFSFYLLHPTAMTFCRETARYFFDMELGKASLFLVSACVAYCASACAYSWIERPFMKH